MAVARFSESETLSPSSIESDFLVLDPHTFKDLDVFGSETGENCLFQLCNQTRTEGAAKVLRRRMERPWSNADRIRATQESLSFITSQRQAFVALPAFLATRVQYYVNDILPIVTQQNLLEYSIGALTLRASHNRHYFRIRLGVQVSCELIQELRQFVNQTELASLRGELAPLFEEMQELLTRPRISKIPDREIGDFSWRILRIDQVFRMHEKTTIARLLQLIYEMEALVSMADVTHKHGYVLPRIEEGSLRVRAENLVHPFVPYAVANPVELGEKHRVLFLTGPNMGGKTTYLRAFATAFYLAHLGMGVPASSFCFVPAQRLFSSISLNDDMRNGVSYFLAEALRIKAVAQAVADGYRVVALMDEPFKGTNVRDALDASLAILTRFAAQQDCLSMFSSHLIELSDQLSANGQINCCYFAAEEGEGRLRFDYMLRPGVSSQRLGMRVLREEGVFELLDENVVRE